MKAFLVSPNEAQRRQFETAIAQHRSVALSKIFDQYPEPDVFSRLVRAWAPEVIFISIEDPEAAEITSRQITQEFPAIQQVAIHSSQEPWVFRHVLSLRMRELLVTPVGEAELEHSLIQLTRHLEEH